jgi:hypothetical protein
VELGSEKKKMSAEGMAVKGIPRHILVCFNVHFSKIIKNVILPKILRAREQKVDGTSVPSAYHCEWNKLVPIENPAATLNDGG